MKIIQVGVYPIDTDCIKGGVEASVFGLTHELKKQHTLFVLVFPNKKISADYSKEQEQLKINYFANFKKNNLGALLRLKDFAKQINHFQPDICHIHSTSLFALLLFLYLKVKKTPVIFTVHGLIHYEQRNKFKQQKSFRSWLKYINYSSVEFMILNFSKNVIVDTPYVKEELKKYKKSGKICHLPECEIVPQGIANDFFSISSEEQAYHLLSVGVISPRKGHLYSIQAVKKLIEKYPTIRYTIAGTVTDELYLQQLQQYIDLNGLRNNIVIGCNLPFNEIKELYKQTSIFILHSEEESQGIVFAEAMACGKPIVATNVGGIPHVVKDNYNGYLCNYTDVDAFAKNIDKLLSNDNVRIEMSSRNKESAQQYSWELLAKKVVNVYSKRMKKKSF